MKIAKLKTEKETNEIFVAILRATNISLILNYAALRIEELEAENDQLKKQCGFKEFAKAGCSNCGCKEVFTNGCCNVCGSLQQKYIK